MLACVWLPDDLSREAAARRLFAVSPLLELPLATEAAESSGEIAFLDVSGTGRLHGGAAGLFAAVRAALAPHLPRGLALAPNRFTAEVAARHLGHPVTVAPGDEALFLSRLPLSALPLSASLARRLAPLGLRTLGDFASLPVAAVERRYGQTGVALHRLARGEDRQALVPEAEPRRLAVLAEVEGGADGLPRLEPTLQRCVEQLCAGLVEQGRGVARLGLTLTLGEAEGELCAAADLPAPPATTVGATDATDTAGAAPARVARVVRYELAPAAPEDRAPLLLDLLRLRLEQQPPPATVLAVELEVLQHQSLSVHQNGLFGEVERDAQRRAEALSRLRTLLGEGAVARPQLQRDHRLEQRWVMQPAPPAGSTPGRSPAPPRGDGGPPTDSAPWPDTPTLRVLPTPEELVAVTAGGRTVAFRRGGQRFDVARASPPRRLAGHWWSDPYARDEYDIATPEGAVYRVARDRLARRWYLLAELD